MYTKISDYKQSQTNESIDQSENVAPTTLKEFNATFEQAQNNIKTAWDTILQLIPQDSYYRSKLEYKQNTALKEYKEAFDIARKELAINLGIEQQNDFFDTLTDEQKSLLKEYTSWSGGWLPEGIRDRGINQISNGNQEAKALLKQIAMMDHTERDKLEHQINKLSK